MRCRSGVVAVTRVERWSLTLARLGLLVIAVVTFITSFDAVSAVGAERGAVSPALAWATRPNHPRVCVRVSAAGRLR